MELGMPMLFWYSAEVFLLDLYMGFVYLSFICFAK